MKKIFQLTWPIFSMSVSSSLAVSFLVQSCDTNNIEEGRSNNAIAEVTSQSPSLALVAAINLNATHPTSSIADSRNLSECSNNDTCVQGIFKSTRCY